MGLSNEDGRASCGRKGGGASKAVAEQEAAGSGKREVKDKGIFIQYMQNTYLSDTTDIIISSCGIVRNTQVIMTYFKTGKFLMALI